MTNVAQTVLRHRRMKECEGNRHEGGKTMKRKVFTAFALAMLAALILCGAAIAEHREG